jgi:hypothetical protein
MKREKIHTYHKGDYSLRGPVMVHKQLLKVTETLFLKCSGMHIHTGTLFLNCSGMHVKPRYDYDTWRANLMVVIHLCTVHKDLAYGQ